MVSITPEEVEKAELELLMGTVLQRLADGKPLAVATRGMTPTQIIGMRDQMVTERKALDAQVVPAKPKTTCPLCGEPSPENKTCITCLDTYIAESNKWLEANAR